MISYVDDPIATANMIRSDISIHIAKKKGSFQALGRIDNLGDHLKNVVVCDNEKLDISIVSVSRLDIKGYTITFRNGRARIFDRYNKLSVEAELIEGLYRRDMAELTRNKSATIETIFRLGD